MRSVFFPRIINGPFGDPALYVRLAHRGEALLFDCGDLHALSPREILKISAVFISHAHIDHLIGFDALIRAFLCRSNRLLLFGPTGMADRIAGRLSGYTWNLTEGYPFTLVVREWEAGEAAGKETIFRAQNGFRPEMGNPWGGGDALLETPFFRVQAVSLDHGGIVSLAFTLEEHLHVAVHKDALERYGYLPGPWLTRFKDRLRGEGTEKVSIAVPLLDGGTVDLPLRVVAERIAHVERGMKISYITDASPISSNQEKIVTLAADAHMVIIEAPFSHRDFLRAQQRNHLTAFLAGRLVREARAARLLVFHHSPRYQDDPDLLEREARSAFMGGDPP
jgi:ribonuclease Z